MVVRRLHQFGDGIMSAIGESSCYAGDLVSLAGFRTTVEKKKDPTGDRVVITLDGKVRPCPTSSAIAHVPVPSVLVDRPVGHVLVQVEGSLPNEDEKNKKGAAFSPCQKVIGKIVERMQQEEQWHRAAWSFWH